jgi:hypothetical protein
MLDPDQPRDTRLTGRSILVNAMLILFINVSLNKK